MARLNKEVDILTSVALFQNLDRKILEVLALSVQTNIIRARREVLRAGEPAQGGYLIVNGTLAFELERGFSSEKSDSHFYLHEGSFLGECALLIPTIWDVTVYSHTPVTLMHIPRKDFLQLLSAHPTAIAPIQHILETKAQNFLTACKKNLA